MKTTYTQQIVLSREEVQAALAEFCNIPLTGAVVKSYWLYPDNIKQAAILVVETEQQP